jgi:hypothetical protein
MLSKTNYFSKMAQQIAEKKPELMEYLGAQVLADCNIYAREMTRTMINTSGVYLDGKANAVLVWRTPYAAKVYYTGTPRTEENPHASKLWCEVAKDRHSAEWRKILETIWARMMLE